MCLRLAVSTTLLALFISGLGAPAGARATVSDNLKVLQTFPLPIGNEIEFDNDRIYVNGYSSSGGVHVFEDKVGKLKHKGDLKCSGLTDVAAMKDGLIAIGLQQGGTACNEPSPTPATGFWGGVHVADMTKPSRPLFFGSIELPGGVHTLTRYPNSNYVYTAVGGADSYVAFGGLTHIIDVSDPVKPAVAATYSSPLNPSGCHDILFQRINDKLIGFCPGVGGTEIWDASDPLAPKALGRMLLPAVQLPHQVAVSSDGKFAAISDEAFAGHACQGGAPAGALWFYDISDLTDPQMLGFYGPPRGTLPVGALSAQTISCTAHNFNFIPDSRTMVVAWIGGGTQVIDVSDPSAVKEVALYWPDGAVPMSSYWYRGRIFVADWHRGLEVLKLTR
jgi:hypothetical protein